MKLLIKVESVVSVFKIGGIKMSIAVDFDGVLAEYSHAKAVLFTGRPIYKMIDRVKLWISEGRKVVIFTARADNPIEIAIIKRWCKKYIGEELPVTNKKSRLFTEFWDDKAVPIKMNTGAIWDRAEKLEGK